MSINIVWLYYDLMNTYGDSGNLLTLLYRCRARKIKVNLIRYTLNSSLELLKKADLFLMGGAEDRQQKIITKDFDKQKKSVIEAKMKLGVPGLFICGAYQFLGLEYLSARQEKIPGLGLIDIITQPGNKPPNRLIGDVVVKITHPQLTEHRLFQTKNSQYLVGFENHGGRTYLKDKKQALGEVIVGHGNNQTDKSEGLVSHNFIGTYLHGPVLPRNIVLCDFLIEKALEIKYNQTLKLSSLEDKQEQENRLFLLNKLNVKT